MGNTVSLDSFDPSHLRIYKNIISIQSPGVRVQMIHTLLAGPEYVMSTKRAGVYASLLAYVSSVQRGERPGLLPGERTGITIPQTSATSATASPTQLALHQQTILNPHKQVAKTGANVKAMSYFSSCLKVLSLQEEVALTDEELKKAYKKAATVAHPDKGGSEEAFEAVTRAYAYLSEILKRIKGGREKEGVMEAPAILGQNRTTDAEAWKHSEPVRLNAKNLDMNAFNQLFTQTRMPDPDEDGYGDWLQKGEVTKGDGQSKGPNFGEKFNRDVFHQMFDDEVKRGGGQRGQSQNQGQLTVMHMQPLTLAPTMGVELGRDRPADYTAAMNANLKYTDLKNAYTTDSTFSGQVADVRVDNRSFDSFSTERKSAPKPLANHEMEAIASADRDAAQRERQRQLRAAHHDVAANEYFERMKRLVITEK